MTKSEIQEMSMYRYIKNRIRWLLSFRIRIEHDSICPDCGGLVNADPPCKNVIDKRLEAVKKLEGIWKHNLHNLLDDIGE